MNELSTYEARIRQLAPDVSVSSISINTDGLLNDVVVVNGELVFRFPKQDYSSKHLGSEIKILRLLKNHITLDIPFPLFKTEECLAYRLIPGKALRRDVLMRLAQTDRQAIADQLAQFLKELHGVPISKVTDFELPMADALMKYDGWVNAYERIREKVFPLLMPHVREWVTEHFETHLADRNNFEYQLKMVDTDIPPYHIMFDSERKRINGIIDFGCAGVGDPAIDFGVLIYNYGESFVNRFFRVYPDAESYLKRARFYAGAHEVRWLLTGLERQDPCWFAVHVGSAKDIKY